MILKDITEFITSVTDEVIALGVIGAGIYFVATGIVVAEWFTVIIGLVVMHYFQKNK